MNYYFNHKLVPFLKKSEILVLELLTTSPWQFGFFATPLATGRNWYGITIEVTFGPGRNEVQICKPSAATPTAETNAQIYRLD